VYRKHKVEELDPHQRNQDELIERDTTYRSLLAQRDAALASYAKAKLLIPRLKQTVLQMEATKRTAEANLADAKRRLGKTDIASPIDGILAVVRTHVGEIVQGGKTTFTGGSELAVILDVSKILVRAEVDESEIARVRAISPEWAQPGNEDVALTLEGLIAASREMEHLPRITVEAFRDEEFAGVIERIYPEPQVINNVTTFQIDVVVTSPNREQLLPRMRAEVEFTSEHVSDVLLCPNEAIREGPNGKLGVYVPPKQSTDPEADPVFQPCVFGLNNGMFSEVREGIAEGATVYSKLPRRFGRKD
jgi:multidrug efflux pump subunit AcrA (membrane-fusion protein)